MTISALTFIISTFCGMKDANITKTEKIECIDYMANCAIVGDGYTTPFKVDTCKAEWADEIYQYRKGGQ